MEGLAELSHHLLEIRSCRVVPSQVVALRRLVRERVILSHRPAFRAVIRAIGAIRVILVIRYSRFIHQCILCNELLVETIWRRVLDLNVLIVAEGGPHFDQFVDDLVIQLGIDERHVASERLEHLRRVVLIESLRHVSVEVLDEGVKFVVGGILVQDHGHIDHVV